MNRNVILLHLIDQKFCSQEISGNMILCGIINFVKYKLFITSEMKQQPCIILKLHC